MAHRIGDLKGKTFKRWTVICKAGKNKYNLQYWLCRCECGHEQAVIQHSLTRGLSAGCVHCARKRLSTCRITHGGSYTKLYSVWGNMVQRCTNPKSTWFHQYGGRGIVVCQAWRTFVNFRADMGDPPEGLSLDRIDTNGNYSCGKCEDCLTNGWPANCRWATDLVQLTNKRNIRRVEYDGKQWTLNSLARHVGISSGCLWSRLVAQGWDVTKAVTEPVLSHKTLIEYNGVKFTFPELETFSGIASETLRERLFRGWSIKDAVEKPLGVRKRTLTFNGETHTLVQWAKKVGLSVTAVYDRYNRGMKPEQILTPGRLPPF